MIKKNEQRTSTVFIRGVPATTKDSVLNETFKEFGHIRQAFITKPKLNAAGTSIGYVKFTTIEEASLAINSVKMIENQKVILSFARKKPRKFREPVKLNKSKGSGSGLSDTDEDAPVAEPDAAELDKDKDFLSLNTEEKPVAKKATVQPKAVGLSKKGSFVKNPKTVYIHNLVDGLSQNQLRKKCRKVGEVEKIVLDGTSACVTYKDEATAKLALTKLNNHVYKQKVITVVSSMLSAKAIKKKTTVSRIVIRNLSFKVTEEMLHSELISFGKMLDLEVPKNGEGKIRGFAFVSYINKFEANKALQKLNGKEILGRKIAVDWAVSKDQYVKKVADKPADDEDESDQEEEANDDDEELDEAAVESDEDDNKEDNSEEDSDKESGDEAEEEFKPKREYDDVKEGRTVFLGNLPFDAEKEDIEEAFSVFGTIKYVRMVYDKEKDRPKGIAFVQFDEKDDADSCLARADVQPISVGGRDIAVKQAIDSRQISVPDSKSSGKTGKDNRNLHLAMEGAIKEGTNAADGVSKTDMMKRKLALEAKKKKLKNISFFVSTDRLCIRNMPSTFSETNLKELMSKYGRVAQVKIMRDVKQANSAGIGKSRGYGFVQFAKPEVALAALRATNNNPNIFSAAKRPIVDFSIENSGILTARAKKGPFNTNEKSRPTKKSFNSRWQEKRIQRKESGVPKPKKPKANPETAVSSTKENEPNQKKVNKKKKKESKQDSKVDDQSKVPDQKNAAQKLPEPSAVIESTSESQKGPKRGKKGKSERPNKKQKRVKEQGEEAAFQKLVQNYKGKLEPEFDQTRNFKKWYDD